MHDIYRQQRNVGKVMFLHLSVILFTGGGLCPSIHHRSHDQGGLCPGVSLSEGLCPGGSLSGGVSVQRGLCLGDLCPGGLCPESLCLGGLCLGEGSLLWRPFHPRQRPPYGNKWLVCILLECILVYFCCLLFQCVQHNFLDIKSFVQTMHINL